MKKLTGLALLTFFLMVTVWVGSKILVLGFVMVFLLMGSYLMWLILEAEERHEARFNRKMAQMELESKQVKQIMKDNHFKHFMEVESL